MADLPLNNPNVAFQNTVASTPAPGSPSPSATAPVSTPALPPSTGIQSTDVTTLGQPTINPANLPQAPAYTPSAPPDISTIINQGTAPTAAQSSYDAIGSQIAQLTGQLGNQSSDYSALQTQYGTPQLAATANDLNANIAQIQAQRNTVAQQLKNQYGNDASKGYMSFEQQSVDSELAAKQSAYAATLAAVSGQLSTANTFIENAINNKYTPITNQINALKAQAEMVKTTLDAQQQKQLAAMQAQLADRTAQINANKAISTTMLEKIAVAAANSANPAPSYIVAQAQNAALSDNPSSALAIIAPYLQDPNAAKQEIADIQAKNAATAASYADVNLKNAQAAQLANTNSNGSAIGTTGNSAIDASQPGYTTQIVAGGLTQASIDQTALSNIIDGKTINLTSRSSPAMRAIANRMGELAPGGNIQGNKAQLTSLSSSLKQQTEYLNTTQRAFNTANDTLSALQSYMQKNNINPSQFPTYNSFVAWAKSKGIDPGAQGGYNAQIQTLRAEYAQVLARGGQVTDSTRAEAGQLIPDNLAPSQLAAVAQQLNVDGTNVVNDAQKQVSSVQNQINGILQPSSSSSSFNQTASGKSFDYQAAKAAGASDAEIQAYLKSH